MSCVLLTLTIDNLPSTSPFARCGNHSLPGNPCLHFHFFFVFLVHAIIMDDRAVGKMDNLPSRMFHREIGGRGTRGRGQPSFLDIKTGCMSSLECGQSQSQIVNCGVNMMMDAIPIYSMSRVPSSSSLLVADEGGYVHVVSNWFSPGALNLDKYKREVRSISLSEKTGVFCVKGLSGGKAIFGTGTGEVGILDINKEELCSIFRAHFKGVKNVGSWNEDVVVSCGKEDLICVYDLRIKTYNPVNLITNAHSMHVKTEGGKGKRTSKMRVEPGSLSNCVADFVFLDEFRIISAGSSDGRLKEWDLRMSYKQLNKCNPVQIVEYPMANSLKGYTCLQLTGSKLYASSINSDIFKFDVGTMSHETTFLSPSSISNYTKIDLSPDGNFLVVGSNDPVVHLFSTQTKPNDSQQVPIVSSFKTLDHSHIHSLAVCCPLFSSFDDLSLTTGGDASILTKWSPSIYLTSSRDLEKEAFKLEIENRSSAPSPLKTEFTLLSQRNVSRISNNKENISSSYFDKEAENLPVRKRVCFAKLDSFPNYVVDGMRLPHVPSKIRIKLKPRVNTPMSWCMSPEVKEMAIKVQNVRLQETTPKRKVAAVSRRKRRRFCDETTSPKIRQYFSIVSSPVSASGRQEEMEEEMSNKDALLASPVQSLKIKAKTAT